MRKLLTGYVVSFNRRYCRTGQLFQNRYKSIICQEEVYFKELIRYIHLNPLRSHIISTLPELDRFPFCGHSALVSNKQRVWQEKDYVLRFFADTETEAQSSYRSFMEAGIGQGKREDLSGGGLLRSIGGWSELKRQRERVKGDQRILGDSDFVLRLLKDAEQRLEQRTAVKGKGCTLETIAEQVAGMYGITGEDILSRGREALRVEARSLFCHVAVHDLRVSVTDLARFLNMAASSVSYSVRRGKRIAEDKGFQLPEKELSKQ